MATNVVKLTLTAERAEYLVGLQACADNGRATAPFPTAASDLYGDACTAKHWQETWLSKMQGCRPAHDRWNAAIVPAEAVTMDFTYEKSMGKTARWVCTLMDERGIPLGAYPCSKSNYKECIEYFEALASRPGWPDGVLIGVIDDQPPDHGVGITPGAALKPEAPPGDMIEMLKKALKLRDIVQDRFHAHKRFGGDLGHWHKSHYRVAHVWLRDAYSVLNAQAAQAVEARLLDGTMAAECTHRQQKIRVLTGDQARLDGVAHKAALTPEDVAEQHRTGVYQQVTPDIIIDWKASGVYHSLFSTSSRMLVPREFVRDRTTLHKNMASFTVKVFNTHFNPAPKMIGPDGKPKEGETCCRKMQTPIADEDGHLLAPSGAAMKAACTNVAKRLSNCTLPEGMSSTAVSGVDVRTGLPTYRPRFHTCSNEWYHRHFHGIFGSVNPGQGDVATAKVKAATLRLVRRQVQKREGEPGGSVPPMGDCDRPWLYGRVDAAMSACPEAHGSSLRYGYVVPPKPHKLDGVGRQMVARLDRQRSASIATELHNADADPYNLLGFLTVQSATASERRLPKPSPTVVVGQASASTYDTTTNTPSPDLLGRRGLAGAGTNWTTFRDFGLAERDAIASDAHADGTFASIATSVIQTFGGSVCSAASAAIGVATMPFCSAPHDSVDVGGGKRRRLASEAEQPERVTSETAPTGSVQHRRLASEAEQPERVTSETATTGSVQHRRLASEAARVTSETAPIGSVQHRRVASESVPTEPAAQRRRVDSGSAPALALLALKQAPRGGANVGAKKKNLWPCLCRPDAKPLGPHGRHAKKGFKQHSLNCPHNSKTRSNGAYANAPVKGSSLVLLPSAWSSASSDGRDGVVTYDGSFWTLSGTKKRPCCASDPPTCTDLDCAARPCCKLGGSRACWKFSGKS